MTKILNNGENELKGDYELSYMLSSAESASGVFDILAKYKCAPYFRGPISQVRLAYPIKKQTSAFFGFCYFYAEPELVKKINDDLALNGSVVRFLIVTPPVKAISRQPKAPEKAPEPKNDQPQQPAVLSNEALEQKLEEILK